MKAALATTTSTTPTVEIFRKLLENLEPCKEKRGKQMGEAGQEQKDGEKKLKRKKKTQ